MRISLPAYVGSFTGHPRAAYVGLDHDDWHSMYGTPSSEIVSTKTSAPVVLEEPHF